MTVREPNVFVRLWHWLAGETRPETTREAELRTAVSERDTLIASLTRELREARSDIAVHQREIELLTAVNERNIQRERAESAAAAYHHARFLRGKGE